MRRAQLGRCWSVAVSMMYSDATSYRSPWIVATAERGARSASAPGPINDGMATERIGQRHPGEPRPPAALAVIAAILLYAALPNGLLIGPRGARQHGGSDATDDQRSGLPKLTVPRSMSPDR